MLLFSLLQKILFQKSKTVIKFTFYLTGCPYFLFFNYLLIKVDRECKFLSSANMEYLGINNVINECFLERASPLFIVVSWVSRMWDFLYKGLWIGVSLALTFSTSFYFYKNFFFICIACSHQFCILIDICCSFARKMLQFHTPWHNFIKCCCTLSATLKRVTKLVLFNATFFSDYLCCIGQKPSGATMQWTAALL